MKVVDTKEYISMLRTLIEEGKQVSMIISGSSMAPFLIHARDHICLKSPEYLVATAVARNGKNMTVPCKSLVFLDDTLGNVQQTDIRFGIGFLPSGDYP